MSTGWSPSKLIRLEHHFMRGEVSFMEVAKLFDVDRSNLWRIVKANNICVSPVNSGYNRKQRTICYQLRRLDIGSGENILTPSRCPFTNVKLTYDIYLDKPNSAIVVLEDGDKYIVVAKEYLDSGKFDRLRHDTLLGRVVD